MGEMLRLHVRVVQFAVARRNFLAVDGQFVHIGEERIVRVFAASGIITDGTCVTKQGSMSVGSMSFS